ncbi:hypothetical protein WN943_003973 [Citrus x changshan-huyou]
MLDGKWRFAFTTAESHEQEVGKLRSCFTLFMTTSAILSYYLRLMIDFQVVERKKLLKPPSKIDFFVRLSLKNNVIILHETGILPLSCCSKYQSCLKSICVNFDDARRGFVEVVKVFKT